MLKVRRHRKFMIALWLVSCAIRSAVFFCYLGENNNYWQVDSSTYHKIGVEVSKGKGVSLPDGRPNFYRVPGYSLFLSLCYSVFGVHKKAALWVQIILASFIPVLVFMFALFLFPRKVAVAYMASIAAALHLGLVLYAGFFMTESLFLLLLLVSLLSFFVAQKYAWKESVAPTSDSGKSAPYYPSLMYPMDDSQGEAFINFCDQVYAKDIKKFAAREFLGGNRYSREYQLLLCAGFLLGAASLVRPVGHYFIVLLLGLLVACSTSPYAERFRQSLVLFIGWLIPVSFWLVRNAMLTGYFFFHTLPGGHFLHLSAARVAMHVHDTSYQKARDNLQREVNSNIRRKEHAFGEPLNEIERCHEHEKVAVKYFKMRPLIAMKNWATDIMRASLSLFSAEVLYLESGRAEYDYFKKGRGYWDMFRRYLVPQTESFWLKVLVYGEILFFLFTLIGFAGYFIVTLRKWLNCCFSETSTLFLQSLLVVGFFLGIGLAGGYARMRLPATAFLLIWSSAFWLKQFGCWKKKCR